MENTQVEKFDPSKLMDGVRDRIKATFVSLIPDAQWEQMCNLEMKKFFEPTYSGWNNSEKKPSQFERIVLDLMNEKCREYLNELLKKPEYSMDILWESSSYAINGGSNKVKLSGHLDAMVKEKMPEMMSAMMASVMADGFYQLFSNVQNKLQNYNR